MKTSVAVLLALVLTACATPDPAVPEPAPAKPAAKTSRHTAESLGLDAVLDQLRDVGRLNADAARAERTRLERDRAVESAGQFRLALLLAREDDPANLERAQRLIQDLPVEAAASPVLDLVRQRIASQLEARRQAARSAELQTRIEQLKALEKSIQQREEPVRPK